MMKKFFVLLLTLMIIAVSFSGAAVRQREERDFPDSSMEAKTGSNQEIANEAGILPKGP